MPPEREHWEFAWLEPDRQAEPGFPRAAALRAALWMPGEIIKIAFLDDDHELRHHVAGIAGLWVQPFMANLTFRYIADPRAADIRISFNKSGSWSCVGNSCRYIKDPQQPTMNFGWLNQDSAQAEIRRVVLHEFGHALGLVHEHSSPAAGIQWDRARVIQDLSYWSPEKVETNVFNAYAAQETNFTAFDPQSIMVYPIPAAWTLDGFSVSMNDDLSPMDRVFIQQTYP